MTHPINWLVVSNPPFAQQKCKIFIRKLLHKNQDDFDAETLKQVKALCKKDPNNIDLVVSSVLKHMQNKPHSQLRFAGLQLF